MGIAPVVTDGALVLGESVAICDYINVRYGKSRLSPAADSADFSDYLFWFHWSNATYMATRMIAMGITFSGGDIAKVPFVGDRLRLSQDMLERRLGEAPFLGGQELTLADIMMVYTLTTSRALGGGGVGDLPNTLAYLHRIAERPAYQRAMAKAEPGMASMID